MWLFYAFYAFYAYAYEQQQHLPNNIAHIETATATKTGSPTLFPRATGCWCGVFIFRAKTNVKWWQMETGWKEWSMKYSLLTLIKTAGCKAIDWADTIFTCIYNVWCRFFFISRCWCLDLHLLFLNDGWDDMRFIQSKDGLLLFRNSINRILSIECFMFGHVEEIFRPAKIDVIFWNMSDS